MIEPSESKMYESDQGGSKLVVIGKPGCFAPGTGVLMYDGDVKKVEDIVVGDVVMGNDGTPRNVLELCANVDRMYEIIPSNDESYIVNSEHELAVVSSWSLFQLLFQNHKDIPLEHIDLISVAEYIHKPTYWKRRHKIIKSSGVEWPEQKLDIDPYVLGVWLHEGNHHSAIRLIGQNMCEKAVNDDKLDDENPHHDLLSQLTDKDTNCIERLLIKRLISQDLCNKVLNKYDLLSYNKHIPRQYKTGSKQQRRQLLAGLIDRQDCCVINNSYSLVYTNEQLIDDIIFVARSLGLSAHKSGRCATFGSTEKSFFKCSIYGYDVEKIPVKLKQRRLSRPCCVNRNHLTSSFEVKYVDHGQYYGFRLDGNNLFLLSSFDVVKNTGKSVLLKSLLYAKKHIFPVGMVFSGTEDSNRAFAQHFPETFVYEELDIDRIDSFIRRQKIARQHLENPWATLIIDDCTDDPKILNHKIFKGLFKNGRHWKMLMILSLQYCMDVNKGLRPSIDGVFILREPNLAQRKSLYENYGGIIPDFKMFCDILDQITDDYTALYIHNRSTSNKIEDNIFWYKAVPCPDNFKFGSKEYWTFHTERFDSNYRTGLM